jgi:ubiquinone/menaquinone biosynthesis C-methylase UbiE
VRRAAAAPVANRVTVDAEHERLVERSIRRYRSAHRRYDRVHPEIFNPVEQARLRAALERAAGAAPGARALDFGCGSGNVTAHLLELGMEVTAADVSSEFLRTVRHRYGDAVRTLRLNGRDLAGVPDGTFDLVAAYSVLHHVPDYLHAVRELCRVTRPGGIVYIDHEANDGFWAPDGCAHHLRLEWERRRLERPGFWNPERRRWQRYLMPSKYALGIRLLFDPDWLFGREGDIHVWAEDRVEWERVIAVLEDAGCAVLWRQDYLNYNPQYPNDLYEAYRERGCSDMTALAARRGAPARA